MQTSIFTFEKLTERLKYLLEKTPEDPRIESYVWYFGIEEPNIEDCILDAVMKYGRFFDMASALGFHVDTKAKTVTVRGKGLEAITIMSSLIDEESNHPYGPRTLEKYLDLSYDHDESSDFCGERLHPLFAVVESLMK